MMRTILLFTISVLTGGPLHAGATKAPLRAFLKDLPGYTILDPTQENYTKVQEPLRPDLAIQLADVLSSDSYRIVVTPRKGWGNRPDFYFIKARHGVNFSTHPPLVDFDVRNNTNFYAIEPEIRGSTAVAAHEEILHWDPAKPLDPHLSGDSDQIEKLKQDVQAYVQLPEALTTLGYELQLLARAVEQLP